MKKEYLDHLKRKLEEFEADKADIRDILDDYGQLYDDALSRGMDDDGVFDLLGNPDDVAHELLETLRLKRPAQIRRKFIALMPFVSVIAFMLLGLLGDLWDPGWLVFLSIPMTAILLGARGTRSKIAALSPFVAIITFIILGQFDLWHPGWLVFLVIPVAGILTGTSQKRSVVAIMPFISVVAFVFLGLEGLWNPGWLVFLSIPMTAVLFSKDKVKTVVYETLFIIAIVTYLWVGYTYGQWAYGALAFLLPVIYGVMTEDIVFFADFPKDPVHRRRAMIVILVSLLATVIFVITGMMFGAWGYMWQVFLLIPVTGIIVSGHFRVTAIAPFVATILFFSLGYFLDGWTWSWLVFLLIPMAGIIEN
jgi:uncharacterized membrane protein